MGVLVGQGVTVKLKPERLRQGLGMQRWEGGEVSEPWEEYAPEAGRKLARLTLTGSLVPAPFLF